MESREKRYDSVGSDKYPRSVVSMSTGLSSGYPSSSYPYPMAPPPPSSSLSSGVTVARCYSPVPLVDYPGLVDFREPVFVEASESASFPIRLSSPTVPWVQETSFFLFSFLTS